MNNTAINHDDAEREKTRFCISFHFIKSKDVYSFVQKQDIKILKKFRDVNNYFQNVTQIIKWLDSAGDGKLTLGANKLPKGYFAQHMKTADDERPLLLLMLN